MQGEFDTFGQPPTQLRRGIPGWVWVLLGAFGFIALIVIVAVGWFVYAIAKSPDTFVYTGNQTPASYLETAEDMGLLKKDEEVLFFYSDGLLDVEDAMYILTDEHLVLYSEEWVDPKRIIAFDEVVTVTASWSDQWIMDSMITVELDDSTFWTFPLSMENDTDHRFVEKLCESAGVETPP
jgi:hypothetical protein